MPIDIGEFRAASEEDLQAGGPTNGERILAFLAVNADKAYTPSEIQKATGIPRGSVGVVLSRLEADGAVDHRGEYWAIADGEDWRDGPVGEWAREHRGGFGRDGGHGVGRGARRR